MKKSINRIRIIAVAVLGVILLLALTSCQNFSEEKQMEMKTKAEIMVECIMKNDAKTAFDHLDSGYISREEFNSAFPQMVEYVGRFSQYTLSGPTGYRVNTSNGTTYVWATYLVDTDNQDFYIEVGTVGDIPSLSSCHVSLKEDVDVASGLPFSNIIGKSVFQIIVLLIGLAELAFTIWMVVDCAKKKIKNKALWIVLILLAHIALIFTITSEKFNFNGSFGFILAISTLAMSDNVIKLRIAIPLGAIIYFALRNKLIINDQVVNTSATDQYNSAVLENNLPNSYDNGAGESDNANDGVNLGEDSEKTVDNNEEA